MEQTIINFLYLILSQKTPAVSYGKETKNLTQDDFKNTDESLLNEQNIIFTKQEL